MLIGECKQADLTTDDASQVFLRSVYTGGWPTRKRGFIIIRNVDFMRLTIFLVIHLDNYRKELSNKRELRKYELTVNYTNTSFVDYLGPMFFNSMPFEFKKNKYFRMKGLILKAWYINIYFWS